MDIQKMHIDELKPADYNPRIQLEPGMAEYEKLKRSLESFGFVETPVFNKRTGRLVGGHQRVRVAKDLGYTEIDVSIVDLDEEKEKALNVALNKISGSWDEEKLEQLLKELDGDLLDLTGFDADELLELMPETPDDADEDDFDLDEETPEEPFTAPGDIWELGPHRVICGDATEPDTIEKLMPGETADLYLTDPPYNVDYTGKTEEALTINNDSFEDGEFYQFLFDAFQTAASKLKPGGAFYIWHADRETANFRRAANNTGLEVRQGLIWAKHHFTFGRSDYQWRHEPCLYGWKEGAAHYFIDDRTQDTILEQHAKKVNKMTKQELQDLVTDLIEEASGKTTVLRVERPASSREHPTMKPIKLMARLIINSSKPGETVLDNFGGSGSTLIAADQLNRKCRMVELDPIYTDVIVKRYIKFVGGTEDVKLIRDGKEVPQDEWDVYLV